MEPGIKVMPQTLLGIHMFISLRGPH